MPGGTASAETPHAGVQIFRDGAFGMAHIYGDTRYDVMFGAGYATAEERLFAMDAIRHTAKGTLAGLLGPGGAADDAQQLTDQDFTDEELTAAVQPARQGSAPPGERDAGRRPRLHRRDQRADRRGEDATRRDAGRVRRRSA